MPKESTDCKFMVFIINLMKKHENISLLESFQLKYQLIDPRLDRNAGIYLKIPEKQIELIETHTLETIYK